MNALYRHGIEPAARHVNRLIFLVARYDLRPFTGGDILVEKKRCVARPRIWAMPLRPSLLPSFDGVEAALVFSEGHLRLLCLAFGYRIIPACAGNTPWKRRKCKYCGDHPRVCGEHLAAAGDLASLAGSSPRVRGTQQGARTRRGRRGIIPACAGNTRPTTGASGSGRDHPRVCGEHTPDSPNHWFKAGSSPRVRGTHAVAREGYAVVGIIPACAGNTASASRRRCSTRDHPRVCGEHKVTKVSRRKVVGSSPRVRGTPHVQLHGDRRGGIIPACAGNTPHKQKCESNYWDHPRVCGEHSTSNDFSRTPAGSSPRVRGTRGGLPARRHGHRIIPACAGNTSKAGPGAISTRDHPRVCGEHAFLPLRYEYREGSSPRVRGTRKHTCATCRTSGIIPACAGNTTPPSGT